MTANVTLGDSFIALAACKDPFVMVEGPRGTAKTRSILSLLLGYMLQNPGAQVMLARSTRVRLSSTVLVTLEKQVFPAFGMKIPGTASREHRTEYKLSNGSAFIPIGLDDPQRSQSAEYAKIYVAEAVELNEVDDVLALAGTLRQPNMPDPQCLVDCNPWAPGHWLNKKCEAIDDAVRVVRTRQDYRRLQEYNQRPAADPMKKWKRIVTKHQDNPGYWDHKTWDWTPAGRHYVKTTLESLSGFLRDRWLDGLWTAADGTVYPEFNAKRHVVNFKVPDHWPWYVGYDPGYDHPTAILWFTVAENGTIYVADEIYTGGKSVDELAVMVHQRNANRTVHGYFADPQHAFSSTAQSPLTIAQQFAKHGITFSPWPRSTDVQSMVAAVRDRLKNLSLKVFETCGSTIDEFQTWSYKRNAKGEQLAGDDQFEDRNNHAMDVIKGMIAQGMSHATTQVQARNYLDPPKNETRITMRNYERR